MFLENKKRIKIAAMIAAAGQSTRMGFHKALLPFYGTHAITYMAQKFSAFNPHRLFVTLPYALILDAHLREELSIFHVVVLPNRYPDLGYGGSIKTVLEECGDDSDGILINPVDSPLIFIKLLFTMINLATIYRDTPVMIVPQWKIYRGHPIYVSKELYLALKNCTEEGGMRTLMARYKKYLRAFFWPDERILLNLNTYGDVVNALTV